MNFTVCSKLLRLANFSSTQQFEGAAAALDKILCESNLASIAVIFSLNGNGLSVGTWLRFQIFYLNPKEKNGFSDQKKL